MMLEMTQVSHSYVNKQVLDKVNLELNSSTIYGLLGSNGTGKTTILKIIAGLIKSYKGKVTIDGKVIGVNTRNKVSFMPTDNYLKGFDKIEDVANYIKLMYSDFDEDHFNGMLNTFKLPSKDKVDSLSTGMLARLKIAVALSRNTLLYLLDEPLNGIDVISRDKIIRCIVGEIPEQSSMVISSNMINEVEKIIDHAIFIKDKKVYDIYDVEQLRYEENKSVEQLYKEIYNI